MQSDQNLLIATYKAFNARDIDSVLAIMHPDIDWPNGWEGGRVHGHSELRDYWTRQWAAIDPHVDPVNFESDQTGRTVVHVHQTVRDLAGNLILDQMVQHIYSIQNGLIRSMEIKEPAPGLN